MLPFAILFLKVLVSHFAADIADHTASILVFLTQQTVLFDTSYIRFVVELTRLGIFQTQFTDDFSESLLLTVQSDMFGRNTRDVSKEDDGRTEDECHQLILSGTLPKEHQYEERHQYTSHHQVETTLREAVQTDAVDGADPEQDQRRNGYQCEMTVEPVVVSFTENRLCRLSYQRHCDEPHHHPCHATLG